jgi:hypothetical protein
MNTNNSNLEGLEYTLRVWLGDRKMGEKLFEVTTEKTEARISTHLDYGQIYYAEVFAVLPNGNESMKSQLVFRIVNNIPNAPTIQITPSRPRTTTDLNCSIISRSIDPDGDDIEYIFYWYKNGIRQQDYDNTSKIPSSATLKGDTWRCIVIPFDNIDLGINASASVLIQNSVPTIAIESPLSEKEYTEDKIIKFNFFVTDPDPADIDNLQYIVFDKIDGDNIRSGYVQSETGQVEFTKKLSKGLYELVINVSDGTDSSEMVISIEVLGKSEDGNLAMMLAAFYIILIITIILIILFIFLFIRTKSIESEESKPEIDGTAFDARSGKKKAGDREQRKEIGIGIEIEIEEDEDLEDQELDEDETEEELEDEELETEELEDEDLEDVSEAELVDEEFDEEDTEELEEE